MIQGYMSSLREATPIILTPEERAELESLARSTKTEHRTRFKARIVLMAADGAATRAIGRALIHASATTFWRPLVRKSCVPHPVEGVWRQWVALCERCLRKSALSLEEGEWALPMLAKPFGAVLSWYFAWLSKFHWRSLGVSDCVGMTGPHPTEPQDEDVPCWATAAPDRRASAAARPINATALHIGLFL
jgi:hypothetical protein